MLAIMTKLSNGIANIRQCQVLRRLADAIQNPRRPQPGQNLDRTDIKVAVVKKRLELRHFTRHESAVLAYGIAAHRRCVRFDILTQEVQGQTFGARGGNPAFPHPVDQA